jgi:hypothetical protein
MALATGSEVIEEERPTDLEFNSPSVGILAQRFMGPGKCQVLDLGAPTKDNVAFFSGSSCKFYVEDLHRFYIAPRDAKKSVRKKDDDLEPGVADILSHDDRARFDLILGWDLFNYMDRPTIESLMARVSRCCRNGTMLFLTIPTVAMIPSRPARISMTRRGKIHYDRDMANGTISNPRFSPTALESMMPGFRLLHSFLLGGEMQEFLFSYT